MTHIPFILADAEDIPVKGIIIVLGLILWGISALAKAAKEGIDKQKERMRQVREQMARDQHMQQRGRPPVPLAPEIARRVPPPVRTQQRRPQQRPATNYNAMAPKQQRRVVQAPPPLPTLEEDRDETRRIVLPETVADAPPAATSATRKPASVGAGTIHKWLTPATLRQQFILTEVFQPPIALREPRT